MAQCVCVGMCAAELSCAVLTTETTEKTQENCREQMKIKFLCFAKVSLIFKLNIITFNLTSLSKKCKPQVCV